jgi:2-dehydro-3-deoxygluconokinase
MNSRERFRATTSACRRLPRTTILPLVHPNGKNARSFDLVSLGEPLLRLTPPSGELLRRAASLSVHVVGSQLNVAADLARLGRRTMLLSKVPDNPLGMLVLDACRSYGLDVSHVKLAAGGKMGVTWVEQSAAPRVPLTVFDRAGSAASTIAEGDFPWASILSDARFACTDGIFPGLSASCARAAEAFLAAARACGCVTCFDVNYRSHLWTPEAARATLRRLLPHVDILATSSDISGQVFGFSGPDEAVMEQYAREFGCRVVCLTNREMMGLQRGAWNSKALAEGRVTEGLRQEFEIVDRYGTGDAWFAGFLHGSMSGTVEYALSFGNALCALAHTQSGDVAHVTAEQVEAVMGAEHDLRVKR